MSDPEQTKAQWADAVLWFAKANDDIRVAELALAADPPMLDPAAFHCQQAVEKIIKGLLVAACIYPPRSHDIETLADKAGLAYPNLANEMRSFAHLTEWLTASRYPDLGGGLGEDFSGVADALAAVKDFRKRAAALEPK
jgi:HEPN domain-containing protein